MKHAFLFLCLGTTACARQADPVPKPPAHAVGWRVDGQDVATGAYVSFSTTPGSTLTVYGRADATGGGGEVQLEVPAAVGTYTFGAGAPAWATYAAPGGLKYGAGAVPGASGPTGPGSVVLTSVSGGVAVGTFTFTGIEPVSQAVKNVTNGTFRVPI